VTRGLEPAAEQRPHNRTNPPKGHRRPYPNAANEGGIRDRRDGVKKRLSGQHGTAQHEYRKGNNVVREKMSFARENVVNVEGTPF